MTDKNYNRSEILKAITAPLGFFVLALLIVEAFLATVLIGANLESADKVTGMWLGVSLFVLISFFVFFLVWFKPKNLTFDKDAHLEDGLNHQVETTINNTRESVVSIIEGGE